MIDPLQDEAARNSGATGSSRRALACRTIRVDVVVTT
jgi:hypothetical protein